MTYKDVRDFLHIAENAYNVGAYYESAMIVQRMAYLIAGGPRSNGFTPAENRELTELVKKAINRFTDCPDECAWEDTCGLIDLFRP